MYILLLFVLFLVELLTGPTGKEEASVFVIYFYLSFVFCFLQKQCCEQDKRIQTKRKRVSAY